MFKGDIGGCFCGRQEWAFPPLTAQTGHVSQLHLRSHGHHQGGLERAPQCMVTCLARGGGMRYRRTASSKPKTANPSGGSRRLPQRWNDCGLLATMWHWDRIKFSMARRWEHISVNVKLDKSNKTPTQWEPIVL